MALYNNVFLLFIRDCFCQISNILYALHSYGNEAGGESSAIAGVTIAIGVATTTSKGSSELNATPRCFSATGNRIARIDG